MRGIRSSGEIGVVSLVHRYRNDQETNEVQ